MNDYINNNDSDYINNKSTASPENQHNTTVITKKKECIYNKLSVKFWGRTYSISGWRAYVMETVAVGVVIGSMVLVGSHIINRKE